MAQTVLITLTTAGSDTGPFSLYSDVDAYVTPFETGISKAALISGYLSILVPDFTSIVRVKSANLLCTNYADLTVTNNTTTTTSTTSTTTSTTSTTTTTSPPTYLSYNLSLPNVVKCSSCPAASYPINWFTALFDSPITVGARFYTNTGLSTPAMGGNNWFKLNVGSGFNLLQIDNSGYVITAQICAVECP